MFVQSPQMLLMISICLFMFGVGFGFWAFPKFLRHMIKSQMNVAKDSTLRPMYEKTPFFLNFRLYIFNITNKNEFIEGKKPKLQEVGPYFFEEWKEKFDLIDNEEEDTLTYHYKNTFIFRPDLSGPGLTGDEIFVLPHPMIAGIFLATNVDKQPLLPQVGGAIKNLFNDPSDAFYTGRIMDILFDGVPVDCSAKDQITGALCLTFEGTRGFRRVNDTHLAFSIFGGVNATDMGEMKVYRGKKNHKDLARLIAYNGDTESDAWDEDECNQFVGTDTTIIPPLIAPEKGEVLWGFDPSVCRSIGMSYANKKFKLNGIPVYVYDLDIDADINKKACFCRDEENCPPKGTFDLFRCGGIPMYGSLPHFYKAEQLLTGIASGLHPNKSEHSCGAVLEVLTGTPLSAAKRLQFNLEVKPIPQIDMMKNFPEVILPFFWVEEGIVLDKELLKPLKTIFWMINIVAVLKWTCIMMGAFGLLGAGAWMVIGDEN